MQQALHAGPLESVDVVRGPDTGEIDLNGGMAMPGFVDVHVRLMDLGRAQNELNLVGTASRDAIFAEVMEKIISTREADNGRDAWIVGNGWDQNDWPNVSFPGLSDLPPGPNPVCLWRIDGRTIWVNELALRVCGIDKNTPDPEGGRILRDALGNQMALDVLEHALAEVNADDHRFRLEHAQFLTPEDFARLGALDVIPTIMPTHATSDMPWAEQRLGPERIQYAYAWRTLFENANHIALGSEAPVENPSPLWGVYAAVTRQNHEGLPEEGWFPQHRLELQEALRGYTTEAAYAGHGEDVYGGIQVGKVADLTLLDRDLTNLKPVEILDTQVLPS